MNYNKKINAVLITILLLIIICPITSVTTYGTDRTFTTLDQNKSIIQLTMSNDTCLKVGSPNSNYGSSNTIGLRNTYGSGDDDFGYDTMLHSNLSGFSQDTTIKNANIYIYYYEYKNHDPAGRHISCYINNGSWEEETVTYNNAPEYNTTEIANGTIPSSQGNWMSINVTESVQSFVDGSLNNYGWRLIDSVPWNNANIPIARFRSKEYGDHKPYIDITYNGTYDYPTLETITNETKNITETSATLNGYLTNDTGENCSTWFEWGQYPNLEKSSKVYQQLPVIGYDNDPWVETWDTPIYIEDFNYYVSGSPSDPHLKYRNSEGSWIEFDQHSGSGNYVGTWTDTIDDDVYGIRLDGWPENGYYYRWNWYTDKESNTSYILGKEFIKIKGSFSLNISDLDPGKLYYCRAASNNSDNTSYGENSTFLTRPYVPTNFSSSIDEDHVFLEWMKGNGANTTYIEKNTSENWTRGEGTFVYNGTDSNTTDYEISLNQTYFYRAWSQANWTYNPTIYSWSSSNASTNITTILSANVSTENATDIHPRNATLNGRLINDSGEACEVGFQWGTNISDLNNTEDLKVFKDEENSYSSSGNFGDFYNPDKEAVDESWSTWAEQSTGGTSSTEGYLIENMKVDTRRNVSDLNWKFKYRLSPSGANNSSIILYFYNWSKSNWSDPIYDHTTSSDTGSITKSISLPLEALDEDHKLKMKTYMYLGEENTNPNYRFNLYFEGMMECYNNKTSGQDFFLKIEDLEPNTKYFFRAFANNSYGTSYGDILNFTTTSEPPQVETKNPTGITNQNATLVGNLTYDGGEASNVWFEWGKTTDFGNKTTNQTKETGELFSFDVDGLHSNTTYWYRAVANNSNSTTYGENISFVTLVSKPNVSTNITTGIVENNATLRGYVLEDGGFSEGCSVVFEWGATPDLGNWTTEQTGKYTGDHFSFNLTGLNRSNIYYYRAVSNNTLGRKNGTIMSFMTRPQPPQNFTANSYGWNQINLTWDFGEGADKVIIERTITPAEEMYIPTWNKGSGTEIYNGTGTNYEDSGLNYGQRYTYQAWSYHNESGYHQYSTYVEVNSTTQSVEKPTVSSELFENREETTIRLKGKLNDDGGDECNVWFIYGTDENCTIKTTNETNKNSGYEFDYDLSGLSPGTLYYYRAVAENVNGSTNGSLRTFVTKPMEPTGLDIYAYNSSTLNLSWSNGSGAHNTYIERNNVSSWARGNGTVVYEGNKSYYNDTSLNENKTYYYKIWSLCVWLSERDYSDNYDSDFETTLHKPNVTSVYPENNTDGIPTDIGSLNAKIIDKDGDTIDWTIETYPDVGNNSGTNITGENATCSLSELTNGVIYKWYVNLTAGNDTVSYMFNFSANSLPQIFGERPFNNSDLINISTNILNVTIFDSDNDYMDWFIETSPDVGSSFALDQSSGNKECAISDLQYGTNYEWYVNVTDGKDWNNKTFYFATNHIPEISNPAPINGTTCLPTPMCNVTIDDYESEIVKVEFFENSTGSWILQKTVNIDTSSESNANFEYDNASLPNTKYWWKVVATDPHNATNQKIFNFDTNNPMHIFNETPEDETVNVIAEINQLSVNINNPDGDLFNWTITTSPNIGNSSGVMQSNGTKTCSISGLSYGTTYTWVVNVSDNSDFNSTTFQFSTATPPELNLVQPENNTNTKITPVCSVNTSDTDGGIGTLTFYENSTGAWKKQNSLTILFDSTVMSNWTYNNATTYGKKYWWKANITDDRNYSVEKIFCFTPENLLPTYVSPWPGNNSVGIDINFSEIQIDMHDPEGDLINWSIETSPDIGSSYGNLESNGTKSCSVSGLAKNTTYRWYVNSTNDILGSKNRSFIFKTSAPPEIFNETPGNGTEIEIKPKCKFYVNDPDSDFLNIKVYENSTGTWKLQRNISQYSWSVIQVQWEYINASTANNTYWWKVIVDDNKGCNISKTFHFTTDDSPTIYNETPHNRTSGINVNTSQLSVIIEDPNGDNIDWTIETSPDIGSNSATSDSNGTKYCSISGIDANMTYTWYVNVSDGDDYTNRSFVFYSTRNPYVTSIDYLSTPISIQTELDITVMDYDGDLIYIEIFENTTGTWKLQNESSADATGTVLFKYDNATEYDTKYWFKVNLSDQKGGFYEKIFNFTTEFNNPPQISNENPINNSNVSIGSSYLILEINDPENQLINYTIETSPNIGSTYANNEESGEKFCPIGTLSINTTYTWWVNATDGNSWNNKTFYFTTGFNQKVIIENPSITNGTTNLGLNEINQLSINISDPDGDKIQWSIETVPDIGNITEGEEYNGTKSCNISQLSGDIEYIWYVNATDGYQWTRKYYTFSASKKPIIVDVYPVNGSDGVGPEPECRLTVDDPDETYDNLYIYWYEYKSGDWILKQRSENLTALPCTRSWNYSNATNPDQYYWWKVKVVDSKGASISREYYFIPTQNEKPELHFPNPSNSEYNVPISLSELSVTIDDREDDKITWSIETIPDIGSNNAVDVNEGNVACPVSGLNYGTEYVWWVNVSDADGSGEWNNTRYNFTTSYWPEITDEFPLNNSRAYLTPECTIDVFDGDENQINIKFYENTTGIWKLQKEINITADPKTTVEWEYDNASTFGERYFWKINVSDPEGHYTTKIYDFVTNRPPQVTVINPGNNSVNRYTSLDLLEVYIEDPEGDLIDWTIETSPDIGWGMDNNENNGTKNCAIYSLQPCTVYTWWVNVTDGVSQLNNSYNFRTECFPEISPVYPTDNEHNIELTPVVNFTIYDQDGEDVEIKIQENTTGAWVQRHMETVNAASVQNIIWDKYQKADYYSTYYWWKVIATDEHNNIQTETFKFKTLPNNHPEIKNESPQNLSTNIDLSKNQLIVDIGDVENHQMDWSIETSPDIGSNSSTAFTNQTVSCNISNLVADQKYTWFVNVTDGYNWTKKIYYFNTTQKTLISNPLPSNNSVVKRRPVCNIDILDVDGDVVDVEIFRKEGSVWISEQVNNSVNASTTKTIVWNKYSEANEYSKNYWWKVIATDEKNSTNSKIFNFRTVDNNHPLISEVSPNNGSTGISVYKNNVSVKVNDLEGHDLNVTIHGPYLFTNHSTFVGNNTYYAQHTQRLPYAHNVKWYVNISDGYNWTNNTFHFYTEEDVIDPVINSVNVTPKRAKKNSLIVINANITDNDEVDFAEVVFPSLGKRFPMYDAGHDNYIFQNNFTILGNYLFYICAEDIWGNENISDYYNFTIVAKEIMIDLHTIEYAQKTSEDKMLISITNSYNSNQVTGLASNISCYLSNQKGYVLMNGSHPSEIAPGIYEKNFSITNRSGSFLAWAMVDYNGSRYMKASAFEVKYFAYENITDMSTRLNDLVTLSAWINTNSSREIIEHIHTSSETTQNASSNLENSGIIEQLEETAIGQLFSWGFMIVFLISVFVIASVIYGRRRAADLASKVANLPKYLVGKLGD